MAGRLISPSYTRSYPMVAKRGRGVIVEDVDGNEFLDFSAGIAVTSTGHCHPEVVAAIQKQAAELIHMSGTDFYYESMVTLGERLSRIAPMKGPHKIYYGNSGAEAIEVRPEAGALSHQAPERDRVLWRIPWPHHGCTVADRVQAAAAPPFRAAGSRRDARALSRCLSRMRRRKSGPGQADAYALGCARFIEEKLFKTTLPPEEVAAIFVEPIQGEGGYVVAPTVFMQELRRICDRHGILLVARRDAVRRGPHWQVVGHRAYWRRA
jgi:4-aminobutyrate aminotransferase